MLHIMNTCGQIENLFDHGVFAYDKWKKYMNAICPEAAAMLHETVKKYLNTGNYTFDKDFLPVLNAVYRNPELELLQKSFSAVTDDLNSKIIERFGKELSADLILYLGLGCSAGKVMEMNHRPVILLGIEKILELRWYTRNAMYGLVYHELGHAYHTQHGKLDQTTDDNRLSWVWQLFTEGIAMYFEQTLVGDPDFFHQDTNGWKTWCDVHFEQLPTFYTHSTRSHHQVGKRRERAAGAGFAEFSFLRLPADRQSIVSDPTKRTTGRNRPKRGEHNALSVRRPE